MNDKLTAHIFTFGFDHVHPVTGMPLHGMYVTVLADSYERARVFMLNRFGTHWAFQYQDKDKAGVDTYGLVELLPPDWPPSTGTYALVRGSIVEVDAFGSGDAS